MPRSTTTEMSCWGRRCFGSCLYFCTRKLFQDNGAASIPLTRFIDPLERSYQSFLDDSKHSTMA